MHDDSEVNDGSWEDFMSELRTTPKADTQLLFSDVKEVSKVAGKQLRGPALEHPERISALSSFYWLRSSTGVMKEESICA